MESIQLKVLQVGAKNFPPEHGGTERLVYDLTTIMPGVESHVLVEWGHSQEQPRVNTLPKGIMARRRMIHDYMVKNDIDIVHIHKSSNIPLALMLKLSRFKCVLTVHGCVWRRGETRWSHFTKLAMFIFDLMACISLDKVVLVGKHDWMSFQSLFPSKRISLVQNGVVVETRHTCQPREGWAFLGRISPEKNVLNLIKAANQLSEKLTIYGPISPPNPKYERAFLHELEHSNVEWRGPILPDHVGPTLAKHRVFVSPSFTEGLPFSVLEAAAEGLYLVLSDIRPHRLLDFPECSYIDPNNLDLGHLSSNTLNGNANRAHVANNFSMDKMIEGYLDIYRSLTPMGVGSPQNRGLMRNKTGFGY